MKRLAAQAKVAGMRVAEFRDREDGVMTIFSCFIILMMILVGGLGVDLMRAEMERTRLQNTLDQAVLAAADLDTAAATELDAEAIVQDYFDTAGLGAFLNNVDVDLDLNARSVFAEASVASPVQFMHMLGVNAFNAPASGRAIESRYDVEVSLVLDISWSMGQDDRMTNLRTASDSLLRQLLTDDTRDRVSVNLVPYSEHVNAGQELFGVLNRKNQRHAFSYCIEFPDADFDTTELDSTYTYDQMQHVQWYVENPLVLGDPRNDDTSKPACPIHSASTIAPMSQDLDALTNQIQAIEPQTETSIFLGMKWAAALLDPSMRASVNNLVTFGEIDTAFLGRPAEYDDTATLKSIVVMTDGENSRSLRVPDWGYSTPSHYVHWSKHNFWHYLGHTANVHAETRSSWSYVKYTPERGDELLQSICSAAKDRGIVVWTVGFEITDDDSAAQMETCATTPNHFFRVAGAELVTAFQSIGTQISQLRLTQ